jgi:hypothetical protein
MATRASAASLLLDDDAATNPLAPKRPHFAPRAKRIIFLCMAGAPSHVDTFDYKPELASMDGKTFRGNSKLLASPWKFSQSGKSGLWISDLFPNLQKQADQLCLLRGMKAEIPAHAQASIQLHTGSFQFVRPSVRGASTDSVRKTKTSLDLSRSIRVATTAAHSSTEMAFSRRRTKRRPCVSVGTVRISRKTPFRTSTTIDTERNLSASRST